MAHRDIISIIQTLLFGFIICYTIARSTFSKSVHVEVGFHHYAEMVDPTSLLKMPFNSLVNIGYIVIGIYWFIKVGHLSLSNDIVYYFDMFSLMSIAYGPIQFLRIVTQQRLFAILDQWFTLPIFAWACLFGIFATNQKQHTRLESFILLISITSYGFAFITQYGFEIVLGMHIICTIVIGIHCQYKAGSLKSFKLLMYAVICCIGFILLKVYDLHFRQKHWIFKRISGHFLSKICDILQIHFVAEFFLEILVKRKMH